MTLLEVLVAGVVLLVAVVGFAATSNYAATANAVGHRRTTTTFLRADLMDRLTVAPRAALAPLAGYTGSATTPAFVVDTCYDVDGLVLSQNAGWTDAAFACGAGAMYRSFVGAKDAGNATWSVALYVERVDRGCAASDRYSSIGCSAADLLLTD